MTNSDMNVIEIVDNVPKIRDYWSTGHSSPVLDSQQDLTVKEFSSTPTLVTIKWNRKLDTGDSTQD